MALHHVRVINERNVFHARQGKRRYASRSAPFFRCTAQHSGVHATWQVVKRSFHTGNVPARVRSGPFPIGIDVYLGGHTYPSLTRLAIGDRRRLGTEQSDRDTLTGMAKEVDAIYMGDTRPRASK